MRFYCRPTLLISLVFVLSCSPVLAQVAQKQFDIPAVDAAPEIDGVLDAGEWSAAARVDDLHQVVPAEFSTPSQRTTWYLQYDERFLYVAAQAHEDDPSLVSARTLRQGGSIDADDSLRILVDAFNTKRSGYMFGLNPNAVRVDAIFTDGTRQSDDWEGIWRGAAQRNDAGWAMEMAIPFTTLNFDPNNDTWGVNLWREIARRDETIAWQSQNGRINPTVSGEMSGLQNLTQGKGLDIIPSVSTTRIEDRVLDSSDNDLNPSLDINYKLGNSVNALLTINTDFAATEVDGRQLGLQRFSLFFPEKRTFFLTDFDIFQFGGVNPSGGMNANSVGVQSGTNGLAFFSRRIGLSATREPVDILFGTKFSGRLGGFDFGTLYIRQDEFDLVPESDLAVARIVRNIFGESTLGAIATYGDPQTDLDSSLVGLDFLYRDTSFAGDRTIENQWWIQKSDNEGVSGDDLAYNISLSLPSRQGLQGGVQYHVVEENFRPALGFANRTGVRLVGGNIGYNHVLADPGFVREIEALINFSRWEYLDTGRVQSQVTEIEFPRLRTTSGDFMRLEYKLTKEGLLPGEQPLAPIGIFIPPGEYSFNRYSLYMRSASYRPVSFELFTDHGPYYNGDRERIRTEVEWRPNMHFGLEFEIEFSRYEFPGVTAITRQITMESEIAFDSHWSITALTQYDNVSDEIGINTRLRYNIEAGRDFWLVLNHNMVEDPLDGNFRSTETLAAVKLRYTFRF